MIQHILNLATSLLRDDIFPGESAEYISAIKTPGCDINEHMPVLTKYATQVDSITEMGVRYGFSTRAFLYGLPKKLWSIDLCEWNSREHAGLDPRADNYWYKYYRDQYKSHVHFEYTIADTTKLSPIPSTDLLFIDTFHHKDVLSIELARHGNSAQRYIILHDTETFGERGQEDSGLFFVDHITTSEPGTGLKYAIDEFLSKNQHWSVELQLKNNNGLTILRRQ